MDIKINFNKKVKIITIDEDDDFEYRIIRENTIDRIFIRSQVNSKVLEEMLGFVTDIKELCPVVYDDNAYSIFFNNGSSTKGRVDPESRVKVSQKELIKNKYTTFERVNKEVQEHMEKCSEKIMSGYMEGKNIFIGDAGDFEGKFYVLDFEDRDRDSVLKEFEELAGIENRMNGKGTNERVI